MDRSLIGRANLVLAFARVLHINGQSTQQTLEASRRFGARLGLETTIVPHWSDLQLQVTDGETRSVVVGEAMPTGVNMDRVTRAMHAIGDGSARSEIPTAESIEAIAHAPAAPAWLFTIAAAAGAAPWR